MNFDRFTIALLLLRKDAPRLEPDAEAQLQDAHMAFLADLHQAGQLLAAGPVMGAPDRELRGFSIFRVSPEEALQLHQADPAVRAGRYRVETYPWMLPADVVSFGSGRFPRSMADVQR